MNCLELVQEAAVRVGIVQPSTIENVSSPDPSRKDPDAMILLGALNETMRQAIVKNLFDPFCAMAKIDVSTEAPATGNTYIFSLLPKCPDFAGLLSSYFNIECSDGSTQTFFEIDPDNFLKYWKDVSGTTPDVMPSKNSFKIYNGQVYFISRKPFDANFKVGTIRFSYRSNFGVMPKGATKPTNVFSLDTDTTNIDNELLIAGTVLNYKAYQGMDYQFDMQKYTDYLTALERNRQRNNLFRDTSLGKPGVTE
jgi:hypothetical protein